MGALCLTGYSCSSVISSRTRNKECRLCTAGTGRSSVVSRVLRGGGGSAFHTELNLVLCLVYTACHPKRKPCSRPCRSRGGRRRWRDGQARQLGCGVRQLGGGLLIRRGSGRSWHGRCRCAQLGGWACAVRRTRGPCSVLRVVPRCLQHAHGLLHLLGSKPHHRQPLQHHTRHVSLSSASSMEGHSTAHPAQAP